MTNVAVIGAGPAGLATSLFLARRGHRVTLVEKDPDPPPGDPEACFQSWTRRGVAQARQPHVLLTRSSMVLRAEAPDVLDAFAEAGAHFVTNAMEPVDPHKTERPFIVAARRLVFEAALRRKVLAEASVRWSCAEVTGLVVRPGDEVPRVTGVTLDGGEMIDADLTVDASGRFSQLPRWLEAAGLGAPEETFHDCGFCYMSRWYRLMPGQVAPGGPMPVFASSTFGAQFGFLADGDTFCLGVTLSVRDPLLAAARRPPAFERILAAVPQLAAWLMRGEPISDIFVLARIENRSRTLLREGRPVAAGLALVGDSAMHTNPTLGRGVSMAYVQAQRLAEALEGGDPTDPDFVRALEHGRVRELGVWFDGQAQSDGARIKEIDAALEGVEPRPPTDPVARFFAVAPAVAAKNPAVALASSRMANMLITPAEFAEDPTVRAAVSEYLAADGAPPPRTGPTREAFEALVAGG
jgi:2-polyprenyl-6-methoxyphenol hydroxylase-like FAD-dependent oxidoreductase